MIPQTWRKNYEDARRWKITTYLGRPCGSCGGSERYTTNRECRACKLAKAKRGPVPFEDELIVGMLFKAGVPVEEIAQKFCAGIKAVKASLRSQGLFAK